VILDLTSMSSITFTKELLRMDLKFEFKINSRTSKAEAKVLQHEDSDYDLESNLFKAWGILETKSECIKWMKQQPMKQDTDIFKYSASKEYEFPIIARRARDHLAIPATSAALECVFSVGGDIVTKKWNRPSTSNTRRLLCLQD